MKSNEDIIRSFYQAFRDHDGEKMATHYAGNIIFEDPAFGQLNGEDAKNMWRMLCANANDLKVDFKILDSTDANVLAYWEAHYTFSKTGRKVHNKVHSTFQLENNKIITHKDKFNLWRWGKQALGLSGLLLGWTPYFKAKLQSSTNSILRNFISNS